MSKDLQRQEVWDLLNRHSVLKSLYWSWRCVCGRSHPCDAFFFSKYKKLPHKNLKFLLML